MLRLRQFRMAQDQPKRGGVYPSYGIFIGGGGLDKNYHSSGSRYYKFTIQRLGAEILNSTEQALLKAIDSKYTGKFNGSLELTPSSNNNELDKEAFKKTTTKKIRLYGQ